MTTISCKCLISKLFKCNVRHSSAKAFGSKGNNVNRIMPKEKIYLDKMREQRLKIKEKGRKYLPGILNLQVLGSGSQGSPRALYLFTDQTRYLFNCSEGTQRLALEHKCKLAKLEHIFITRPTWENMGGLPGMALSVQDVGVPHFKLHGPQGSEEIFKATARFVVLRSLQVSMFDSSIDPIYEDDVISIRHVRLISKNSGEEESDSDHSINVTDDETDYYAHKINPNGKRFLPINANAKKQKMTVSHFPMKRISDCMAYICKLKSRPGSLCFEKCVARGVTPGPAFGQLKDGMDITLPNGEIVRSVDVCLPDDPGVVFIVLECPTLDYLDSLLESTAFEDYQLSEKTTDENLAYLIVHFTPPEVMADSRYRDWMNKFGPSTMHLAINEENECLGSESVHRMQYKLHLLHPKIFPLLNEQGISKEEKNKGHEIIEGKEGDLVDKLMEKTSQSESTESSKSQIISRLFLAKTMQKVHLRPKTGFDRRSELKLSPKEYVDEAMADDAFLDALAQLQTDINAKTKELGDIQEYPKLIFLGTGSCAPNKNRNTSGILYRINETTSIVLDCGEGTLTQIMRFYKKEEAYKVLASIKSIYVSHLHADHHMGLIGLLKARAWVTNDPVFVLAPRQISSWLSFYHNRFERIFDKFKLISNDELTFNEHKLDKDEQSRLYTALGATDVSTIHVKHVPNSFGIAITLDNGFKLTYSGDTMPSPNLIILGFNSDVLIHEATMEDELESEARIKMHSTTSQAIDIGKRMKAKFLLLTHFSQRYAKIPRIEDEVANTVGVAFDNMEVRVGELTLLPLFYPVLRIMFAEAYDELTSRAERRKLRSQYT